MFIRATTLPSNVVIDRVGSCASFFFPVLNLPLIVVSIPSITQLISV